MPSFPPIIDPSSAPRARDHLLCQWCGPYFRGACDFLYEPIRGNRATWGGMASAARWRPDGQFYLVPEFLNGSYALARNAGTTIAPTELTVTGWLNAKTLPIGGSIIFGTQSGVNRVHLGYSTISGLFFQTNNGSIGSAVPLVVNRWYHFAGSFCDGDLYVYLDGVLVNNTVGGLATMVYPLDQPPALAGRNVDGVATGFFDGRLFDVRLYNRCLLDDEVLALANPVASQRLFTRTVVTIPPPVPPSALSRTNEFLTDLLGRRIRTSPGGMSTRYSELYGGDIVEPTAYEPDPNTHRHQYYYNVTTNTIYKKVMVLNNHENGVIKAIWRPVNNI